MKKFLITSWVAAAALTAAGAPADIESSVISGELIHSISSNGKWMVSELDGVRSLIIRNLETGEKWSYYYDGSDFGTDYPSALGRCVSDDGVVVAEVANVPSYWKEGKWTNLNGFRRSSEGVVTAVVGSITPDGSMIVGSLGKGGSMFDDGLMTNPCYWERLDDGTYGEPEWLPTQRDFFGMAPQYLNCTDVSDDGNTICASMRCGSGFWHIPFSYTRNDDGSWSIHELGMELINPRGLEIPRSPGDYNGPMYPDYEQYMTSEQLYDFYYVSGPKWIDDLYAQGITDENEIALLELQYAAEFMDEDKRAEYEALLQAFLDQYTAWWSAYEEYVAFLELLGSEGVDFTMNNVLLSHDGKYVYTSATDARGRTFAVRIDARTGDLTSYKNTAGFRPTCITSDYSVLGYLSTGDPDSPTTAYIIPAGSDRAVEIPQYWLSLGMQDNYDWMEEYLYRSVVVSLSASGAEQYADRWCIGKPIATPDMELMGFGTSTFYWESSPTTYVGYYTFLLNTGLGSRGDESGIETLPAQSLAEDADAPAEFYTLDGVRVSNPRNGIFIKRQGAKATKVIL